MLRCIQRPETDPYYNIAAEEFLLKDAEVNTFSIWRNEPSVIIGKHQNALKEINPSFIELNNLPVIRRITGGGAVYHDPGNINFSFIFTDRKDNLIDFREFTRPVVFFLKSLGLNASFEGKNNIVVDGLKVSGNSAHLYKNTVLYHGTLLFNSDLGMLEHAIAGREGLFTDKAVRSVRAKVANIRDLLKNKMTSDEFIRNFREFILNYFDRTIEESLQSDDVAAIEKLVEEKYRTYLWNYGYSPDYEFNNKWMIDNNEYSVHLKVKDGRIYLVEITGPESYINFFNRLAEFLVGVYHEKRMVSEKMNSLNLSDEFETKVVNQIVDHLF